MLGGITIAIAVAGTLLFASAATAGPGGSKYVGQLVGQVTSINREQNFLVLDNSNELRVTDPKLLADLHEGMRIRVDFEQRNGVKLIHEIWPAETIFVLTAS